MIAALLVAAGAAAAAPVADNLVVTATRLAGPTTAPAIGLAPADLGASDSLVEALARLPDVYIQQPGGRSGFGALFLRGADPNFTTVFLDGIPLNNGVSSRGGAVNLSEIGSASLAGVEVAAGPLSSVHGSGALAGAVNLILAGGGDAHELRASAGAGSRGDATGVLGWRGPIGGAAGGAVTVEYDDDGVASPGARFEAVTVTAKLAARGGGRPDRLVVRVNDVRSRQFPDNSGGAVFATLRDTERRTARELVAGGVYRLVESGTVFVDGSGSYLARRETSASPGVEGSAFDPFGLPASSDTSRFERGLAQLVAGLERGGLRMVAGVEAQRETGRSDGALVFGGFPLPTAFRLARTTVSGFAEARATAGPVTLTGGLRADAIDGLATRLTGRAGVRFAATPSLGLVASGGTSFKAPSFYALGNPLVGNRELRAEAARGLEAGAVWQGAPRQSVSVTVFDNRFTDLIDFVADPAPRLINRSLVTSRGVTAGFVQPIGDSIDLAGRVQYVDTRDAATRGRLLNRPEWRAGASLDWRALAGVTLAGRLDFTDARNDVAVPTGPRTLAGYTLLGLRATWEPVAGLSVLAVVDNILDTDYADAIGFAGPGRRARLLVTQVF